MTRIRLYGVLPQAMQTQCSKQAGLEGALHQWSLFPAKIIWKYN